MFPLMYSFFKSGCLSKKSQDLKKTETESQCNWIIKSPEKSKLLTSPLDNQ